MSHPSREIEWIVTEVLRRLRSQSGDNPAPSMASGQRRQLVVADRVVTLAGLKGRLSDVTQLVVPAKAIVTPAVRDELKDRGITLQRGDTGSPREHVMAQVVVAVDAASEAAGSAARMLADMNVVAREVRGGLVDVIADLSAMRERLPAVLVTDQVAAALCLANRQRGVRAVEAKSGEAVKAAADEVAANLLVIAPAARTPAEIQDVVTTFAKLGWRDCPAGWRQWLS